MNDEPINEDSMLDSPDHTHMGWGGTKISELITVLKKMKRKRGDLIVKVSCDLLDIQDIDTCNLRDCDGKIQKFLVLL